MKGSTFLKVMGILCIIFGAIALVANLLSIASVGLLAQFGLSSGLLNGSTAVSVISSIVMLIAGILGVKNCKSPEKAGINIVFGIIMVVIALISVILSMKLTAMLNQIYAEAGLSGGMSTGWLSIVSFIMPVLYLIAAFLLKKNNSAAAA